ncbi:MAG: hypothetical protein J7M18_06690 [Candidatus Eremiobacteraeota bacterium]|nr:hypothetical protein [Candidatus Eremiobacteraeota bacterium]
MDPISRVEGTQFAPRTLPAGQKIPEEIGEKYHALEISDEVSVRALEAQEEQASEEIKKPKEKRVEEKKTFITTSGPKVVKFINQVEDEFYLNQGNLSSDKFKDLDLNGPSYPRGEIITLRGYNLASPPKTLFME